jgi:response regulator NasT
MSETTSQYGLLLLVESMLRDGCDERAITAAVRAADDRPRVLIAEGEPVIRLDVAMTLEAAGFNVCAQAADGQEAIAGALEHRPDAVVLDADLPGLDGVAAADAILADRDIPIVMLSGDRDADRGERALAAGVSRYLTRPFAERELVEALRGALRPARQRRWWRAAA